MNKKHIAYGGVILFILLSCYAFFYIIPTREDQKRNTITTFSPVTDSSIIELHNNLFIADLHADTLLWDRKINSQHRHGHVDIPRLLKGNIGLQIFSVVTKTPRGLNLHSNDDDSDNITLLAIAQRWPIKTWNSTLHRALYQADKLYIAESKSNNQLKVIRSRQDLLRVISLKKNKQAVVGAVLSLEGAHALQGKLENVDLLFNKGYRIIGFSHFFDNELGGSAHGVEKNGITQFGLNVLHKMNQLNMLVDISHAAPKLIDDIFRHSLRPVIATHTGVQGVCKNAARNLSDQHIQKIAVSGGIVGIGFWPAAVCSQDVSGLIKSIRYVVELVGEDYVALGSDFDGNVQTPFDAANINIVTQALVEAGFTERQIQKIMGENIANVLLNSLPVDLETELQSNP